MVDAAPEDVQAEYDKCEGDGPLHVPDRRDGRVRLLYTSSIVSFETTEDRPTPIPPMYEVQITEVGVLLPEVRSIFWRGVAADDEAAKEAGWTAWDDEHGAGTQPVGALVNVTRVTPE